MKHRKWGAPLWERMCDIWGGKWLEAATDVCKGFRALLIKQQAMGTSSRHPAGVSQGLYQTMTYNV
jgi:hypothetical protein